MPGTPAVLVRDKMRIIVRIPLTMLGTPAANKTNIRQPNNA